MLENHPTNQQEFMQKYITGLEAVIATLPLDDIQTVISCLSEAYEQGRRIFVAGNGGSAATASHMACDLSKTTLGNRRNDHTKRFAVIALTDNVASITAWANDADYNLIFAEQLRNLASEGDLLIIISGSGNSPNVLEAAKAARELGVKSLGLLGFDGGAVKELLDHVLIVASNDYGHIEDVHMILTHLITSYYKEVLNLMSAKV
jgi:D-sedoheptulose 7-phosphate isomerase